MFKAKDFVTTFFFFLFSDDKRMLNEGEFYKGT